LARGKYTVLESDLRRVISAAASTILPTAPDPAILRLVRALARQAAREDHEREENRR
jgi:hypothetical protein